MKTINAKRIAAVAASLLMGLAFAGTGGVTWSNIPIINNQGQPVVQVVVGSNAQPSDGVVAANIAAVLGNLAFTSVNVTATPSGLSNVKCVVTTPTCTLTNQQVWFNEKGFTTPSGSYGFTALIGSVLNGGLQLGSPSSTKTLSTSSAYTYPESTGLQISPVASPYSAYGSVPLNTTPQYSTNGGGTTFGSFTNSLNDNILQITPTQLPGLPNNWGAAGETVNLWLTGFPVFNQQAGTSVTPSFQVLSLGGAYTATFNKPIAEPFIAKGNTINNAAISLLGKNWTVLNYTAPGSFAGSTSTTQTIHTGSKLALAQTLTPIQTVYVGHNVSSGGFTVALTDLGQPNSQGQSQASVNVYYNGTLTNVTQLAQGATTKFQVGQKSVYVKVNATFAGLYAYQKWAKIQLYSNLLNLTDGQKVNQTNAPGWYTQILWTNGTSSGRANMLEGIVFYNQTPRSVSPGGSLPIMGPNMTVYSAKFLGDTLGSAYDPVQFQVQSTSNVGAPIQNLGNAGASIGMNVGWLSGQPGQLLTVTSQIPSAFSFAGQSSSTVTYDLTPYALNENANAVAVKGAGTASVPVNIVVTSTAGNGNIINSNTGLVITVKGYTSTGAQVTGQTAPITSFGASGTVNVMLQNNNLFYNVTSVQLSRALPYMTVTVIGNNGVTNYGATVNTMATLVTNAPAFLYSIANQNNGNYSVTEISGNQVTYNQQNGQTVVTGGLSVNPLATGGTVKLGTSNPYFTVNMLEYDVPGSTSYTDYLAFGVYNSSQGGAQTFGFQLNQSATTGTKNNMSYISSQGNIVNNAPLGFITERGSKIAQESQTSVTINMAKVVDTLQFVVGPTTSSTSTTVTSTAVGPVGQGQAVPGFANLTVANVNATCAFKATSCSVTGLSNLTATPSVTQAVVPVYLNTATTPLVVLDSNANNAATLIVVGSKYVNSVAAQVFTQNPSLASSFGTSSVVASAEGSNRILVAGYTAAQTVTAGNQFISQLLQAAGVV
jgi:hypothetical protein